MVQDGEDDLVHVLPQPEVDLLLLLEGFHELMVMGEAVRGRPGQSQVPGLTMRQCPRTELRRPRQGSPKTNLSTRCQDTSLKPGSTHTQGV